MKQPHLSATVALLRAEAHGGFSLFMVQRHRRSGFLPSAWVFPGGRVDPGDRLRGHEALIGGQAAVDRLGLAPAEAVAVLVAALRETFEEAGLWLGPDGLPDALRVPLARGEVALPDLLSRHRARLDLDALHPWSWWITPEAEPRRFDTRILVARADGRGRHDDHETVASGWFAPEELLEGADTGRFPMAPPTWWTVRELAAHGSVDEVLEAAAARPQRPIQPVVKGGGGDFELLLPGHPDHPEPPYPGLPRCVRLVDGRWKLSE